MQNARFVIIAFATLHNAQVENALRFRNIHTSKSALSIPQQPKTGWQNAALHAEYTLFILYSAVLQKV